MKGTTYTSRQRVLETLNRCEPDRIPLDLGSSIETGMTTQAYRGLIDFLGLTEEPDDTLPNLFVTAGGFAQIPENVLRHLKVDVRGALIQLPSEPEPAIGFENGNTLVYYDEWGIKWRSRRPACTWTPLEPLSRARSPPSGSPSIRGRTPIRREDTSAFARRSSGSAARDAR